ncbi:Crp/Fnr family transcriptional regulator [Chryseobacterium sp. T1]
MNALKIFFDNVHPISIEDRNYLKNIISIRVFTKNTIITNQDEVEDYVNFVAKGIARIYHEDGQKQITTSFVFEKEFLTSYDSFLTRTPSRFAIDAVTDVQLLSISYKDLHKIYQHVEKGNFIARKIIEYNFFVKEKRELDLLTKNPTEYYKYLIEEHPVYIQQIPLNYLASYIGVTPQALSRIRKKITF